MEKVPNTKVKMLIVKPLLETLEINWKGLMRTLSTGTLGDTRLSLGSHCMAFESLLAPIRRVVGSEAGCIPNPHEDPITNYGHEIRAYRRWLDERTVVDEQDQQD